jgi:N-acetylmuramoyl-L-alanine amidase
MQIIDLELKFKTMTPGNNPSYIGVHHSGGIRTVKEYHQMHLDKGWSGLGYNFVVDLDGKVYRGRDPKYIPAGILGHNTNSLHICAIGNFENMVMPAVQKEALKELVAHCISLYPTIKFIKGHKELMATDCPGKNYPLADVASVYTHGLIKAIVAPTPSPINNKVFKLQHALNAMNIRDGLGRTLKEDGFIGENTKDALKKIELGLGSKNVLVSWLQEQLGGLKADGVFGKLTHDAVGKYQRENRLHLDFIPGYWTLLKLAS